MVRVHRNLPILVARDAALLAELNRTLRLGELVAARLSDRAVALVPGRVEVLQHRLAEAGRSAKVESDGRTT